MPDILAYLLIFMFLLCLCFDSILAGIVILLNSENQAIVTIVSHLSPKQRDIGDIILRFLYILIGFTSLMAILLGLKNYLTCIFFGC